MFSLFKKYVRVTVQGQKYYNCTRKVKNEMSNNDFKVFFTRINYSVFQKYTPYDNKAIILYNITLKTIKKNITFQRIKTVYIIQYEWGGHPIKI